MRRRLARASPCVTLWTFSLTSPSDDEMRVTPCLAVLHARLPLTALRTSLCRSRGVGRMAVDKAGARHRHALDRGRRARLALLDRAEGAGAAQRKTGVALREGGRMLARHHLRDLAGLEVGDLDLAADHVDAGRRR